MSLQLVNAHIQLSLQHKSTLTARRALFNWPEQKIKEGGYCFVRSGPARIGQLVSMRARGREFVSLLLYRSEEETIYIRGSDGRTVRLVKSEYEIEGPIEFTSDALPF